VSAFENLLGDVQALKCLTCHGHGEYDDADFGDISCRVFKCTACKGTGFRDGKTHRITADSVGTESPSRGPVSDGVSGRSM
jgi:DnaJ-class molecular chaperone